MKAVTLYSKMTILSFDLKITYTGAPYSIATQKSSIPYGTAYRIESPQVVGYTPDITVVTGTMPARNVVVNVTYSINTYTVTIVPGHGSEANLQGWTASDDRFFKSFGHGSSIGELDVVNAGKELKGWYDGEDVITDTSSYVVTKSVTLTAIWGKESTIEIIATDGTADSYITDDADSVMIQYLGMDAAITIPSESFDLVKNKFLSFSINRTTVDGNDAYELTTLIDGSQMTDCRILITIPAEMGRGEPEVTWIEGGQKMTITSIDDRESTVTFETTHNSTYMLSYFVPVITDEDDDTWYQQWLQNYYQQLAEQQRQEQMLKEQQIAKEKEKEKKNLAVAVAGTAVILLSVLALAVNRKSR